MRNKSFFKKMGGENNFPLKLGAMIGFLLFLGNPGSVFAYVGPGAGITMLGALWAVILAVLFAIGGILFWPVRSFLQWRKKGATEKNKEIHESFRIGDPDKQGQ